MSDDFKQIDLQSVPACLDEIQDCARGLAYLDHQYGVILDALSDAEAAYESMEAAVAAGVRVSSDSALTATEIKGRILRAIEDDEERKEMLDDLRSARKRKAKVDRWTRSLEKRLSAAQSAQKGHETLGRYGGAA